MNKMNKTNKTNKTYKTNIANKKNKTNKTKKMKYIGIVAVILLIAMGVFFIYKKTPLPITATENSTEVATESHILSVTLKQASYEEEYGDIFDLTGVDMAITADGTTLVEFADGSASKEYDSIGEKIEQITITDNYHNSKTVEITINVKDTQAPVISGVSDCRITEGQSFNGLGGVVAIDNADGDVSSTLVCSTYDIDMVGTQILTITATDKSGNVASIDFELKVNEKPIFIVETVPIQEETYTSKYKALVPYDNLSRNITCWGDSLTQGIGADEDTVINGLSGATETTALANFINANSSIKKTVYNMGIISEDSRTIACRQGGLKMYPRNYDENGIASNITIPATGSVTFSDIICEDGNEIITCRADCYAQRECFDACIIGGITGKLTFDYKTNLYTFKRAVDGTELIIDSDTAIITPTSIARRNDILVLEMGNNGGWDQDYEVLIKQYDSMIEFSNCKYFIIVGDTDGNPEERGDWDTALEVAYGDHYINMREYLSNNGLTDCDLEPTSVDLDMVLLGEVPISLKLEDMTHLNSYGYYSKGKAIFAKGVQLGYWE